MNLFARLFLWPAAMLAVAGFVLPLPNAAAQQISREWLEGMHAFRRILHERHFSPIGGLLDLRSDPKRCVLVVLGDTAIVDSIPGGIHDFVVNGGALLVASDRKIIHPRQDRDPLGLWEAMFGVEFVDRPVLARNEANAYQGYAECPLVTFIRPGRIPIGENLNHDLATNCSGSLRLHRSILGTGLTPIALFHDDATHAQRGTLSPGQRERLLFAAGLSWGRGRVLFLADHSVFINNMMLRADTGNFTFAFNCLDWLAERSDGRRDRVLLYDDGKIVTDFNVPVTMPPFGLPDDLVALADEFIAGAERERLHDRLLEDSLGRDRILRWTAIALTVLLAIYLFVRLVRSRYRLDTAAPLLAPTLSRFAPVGPGLAQRQAALLGEGNLWEPARFLARDFFETALDTPEPPVICPPFRAAISWPARRMVERLVQHLWQLAYGTKPERIAPSSFAHLAAQLDELKAALADGSLRFEIPATS